MQRRDGATIDGTALNIDTIDFSAVGHAVWSDTEYKGSSTASSNHQAWTRDWYNAVDQRDGYPDTPPPAGTAPWKAIGDLTHVNKFIGSGYNDYIAGNSGNDTIYYNGHIAPGGDNHYDGRGGTNTADFSLAQYAVWVDLTFNDPFYWGNHQAFTQHTDNLNGPVSSWIEIADIINVTNLTGSNFDDYLHGIGDTGRFDGGKGNDTLVGGGRHDTFVFKDNFGKDRITDFYLSDKLEFHNPAFTTAQQVLNAAAQVGSNVVITVDAQNSVTLEHVKLANLLKHPEVFIV